MMRARSRGRPTPSLAGSSDTLALNGGARRRCGQYAKLLVLLTSACVLSMGWTRQIRAGNRHFLAKPQYGAGELTRVATGSPRLSLTRWAVSANAKLCDTKLTSHSQPQRPLHATALEGSSERTLCCDEASHQVVLGPDFDGVEVVRVTRARARKGANGMITGAKGYVANAGTHEWRVLDVRWHLEYELAPLRDGEVIESDVCLVVLDGAKENSVSSGEEVVCVHEHYVRGAKTERRAADTHWQFGAGGGLPLRAGFRVEVGSVSSYWTKGGNQLIAPDDIEARTNVTDRFGLAIRYNMTLRRSSAVAGGVPPPRGLTSVRSPMRDRSDLSFPGFRSPSSAYKNVGTAPIRLEALGVFISILRPRDPMEHHTVALEIDGAIVRTFCVRRLNPSVTSSSTSALVSLRGMPPLAPGSTVCAVHLPLGSSKVSFDAALYLLSDALPGALASTDVTLPGVDLNADGHEDFVDVDHAGLVWADLTRADQNGAHDTQHQLLNGVARLPRALLSAMTPPRAGWHLLGGRDALRDGRSYLRFESSTAPETCLDLDMRRRPGLPGFYLDARFCNESRAPPLAHDCVGHLNRAGECFTRNKHGDPSSNCLRRDHAYADMDGDGYLDRVRVDERPDRELRLLLARGGPYGLGLEQEWFVSTCCRLRDDELAAWEQFSGRPRADLGEHFMDFLSDCQGFVRLDVREPLGSKASVALLELDHCEGILAYKRSTLSPAEAIELETREPWCPVREKPAKRPHWRFAVSLIAQD